ncbi:substrate-binding domain-containing protein [Amycolatopsis rhabdoformis]|uniref:Substrate-binding domain-containing protein n=1 Tax=Amycolatopsis rhabdoformis TaxID=1448059 RepID=A0ABZ1ILL8_9PSEU|nr:substrate-binding domain-containing protein [Amycolatopsis rhabdoformis]WSE34766.1 substrate-binding domain-containing protein [Amycolatopsis rhabdoformis]
MFSRRGSMALAVLLLGGTLAACGAGEPKASAGLSGNALDMCVAKATELKKSKLAEPPLKVLAPFDMAKNKGKSIWIINAARVPLLQRVSDGAQAAATAAGLSVKVVYGDGSTNTAQAAMQQAIAQGANGIALVAVDPTTIQDSVNQAAKAGIVVTDVGNRSVGDPLRPGVAGQLGYDVPAEMAAMAGWIMADSKCSADTLMYSPSALSITSAGAKAFQAQYQALCPSCAFELKDLDYGNFASTLTAEVQTDLRRNPNLDYIFAIIGSSVPEVDAGLRGNDHVRVLTHDGLDDNLEALRKGTTHVVANFAFAPNEAIGWQVIDQQGRLLLGEKDALDLTIPTRMVDATDIGATNDDIWPSFTGAQKTYTAAWK